jgi:hypothetical protein
VRAAFHFQQQVRGRLHADAGCEAVTQTGEAEECRLFLGALPRAGLQGGRESQGGAQALAALHAETQSPRGAIEYLHLAAFAIQECDGFAAVGRDVQSFQGEARQMHRHPQLFGQDPRCRRRCRGPSRRHILREQR